MTAVEKFKEEAGKVWRLGRRVRYYSAECQRETILWQLAAALTSNPAENEMVESLSAILGQYLRSPGVFIAMPQNGKTLHLYPLKSGRSLQRWLWGKVALPAMRMGQWSQWKVSLDHPDNLLARSFRERAVLFETQPGMLLIGGEPGINQARLKCVYKLHLHPVRGGGGAPPHLRGSGPGCPGCILLPEGERFASGKCGFSPECGPTGGIGHRQCPPLPADLSG